MAKFNIYYPDVKYSPVCQDANDFDLQYSSVREDANEPELFVENRLYVVEFGLFRLLYLLHFVA